MKKYFLLNFSKQLVRKLVLKHILPHILPHNQICFIIFIFEKQICLFVISSFEYNFQFYSSFTPNILKIDHLCLKYIFKF